MTVGSLSTLSTADQRRRVYDLGLLLLLRDILYPEDSRLVIMYF